MNTINIDNIKSLQEALKKYVDNTRFTNRNVQITLRMDFTEALINEVEELEERIAIKDEALEALEQRCNALEALEKRLKDPDRINVTHCKDCKHLFDGEQTENCCDVLMEKTGWMHEISVSPDWYCADGETR